MSDYLLFFMSCDLHVLSFLLCHSRVGGNPVNQAQKYENLLFISLQVKCPPFIIVKLNPRMKRLTSDMTGFPPPRE